MEEIKASEPRHEPVTPDQPRPVPHEEPERRAPEPKEEPEEEEDEVAKAARLRAQAARDERAVFDKAAAATAHLPAYGMQTAPLRAGDVAVPGEATVAMMFPRPVMLTLPGYRTVQFEQGLQYVPLSLCGDRYLKASGVKPILGNDTRH